MYYLPREKRLFVAIDESNHGRDEEIFVGAFSFLQDLAEYTRVSGSVDKRRKLASNIHCGPSLDYRFCVVNRDSYGRFGEHNVHLEVARALYASFLDMEIDSSNLYLDGAFSMKQREDMREAVRKTLNEDRGIRAKIPYPAILVYSIPKRKRDDGIKANTLLLFADHRANLLFRASRFDTADPSGKYFDKRVPFPLKT